jgi:hypothetical protein
MAKTEFVIVKNTLNKQTEKYFKITKPGGLADMAAKKAMGLQLLNNITNGSEKLSLVPPIMTGRLRASGSVFVGNKFVGDSSDKPVIEGPATPNKSHSDNIDTVTVGFNTPYAARWHEEDFTPGGKTPSKTARNNPNITGDVGNKYIERHLQADRKELMQLYAAIFKKESGG